MNRILIIILTLTLLFACMHTEEPLPSATATLPPTHFPANPTAIPTESPTHEPPKTIAELGYKVKVGDIECALAQHSNENPNVFMTDCPEIIYMPLNSIIEIELITPAGETYKLQNGYYTLANFANGAIMGEYVLIEGNNLAG